jgi:hypothetical protein
MESSFQSHLISSPMASGLLPDWESYPALEEAMFTDFNSISNDHKRPDMAWNELSSFPHESLLDVNQRLSQQTIPDYSFDSLFSTPSPQISTTHDHSYQSPVTSSTPQSSSESSSPYSSSESSPAAPISHSNHRSSRPKKQKSAKGTRICHSLVEQKYRQSVNAAIKQLQHAIPHLSNDDDIHESTRVTKTTVIVRGTEYIRQLEMERKLLRLENQKLWQMARGNGMSGNNDIL